MQSDATAYLVAAAALAVAFVTYSSSTELQAKVNTCQMEYRGFKEGVIYGK
jgi:hypothetical protein